MKLRLPYQRALFFIMTLFFSLHAFSQLPAFNFNVTATSQTCLNNGVLNFAVSGTVPGAAVTYAVFLQPNVTTPVITTSNTTVPGLGAGTYTITATQSLGGQTSTNTQIAVINNLIVPLTYTLGFTKVRCGNDGTITVTPTSGNPSTYEILSGPVTKPPQASPIFTGLPVGLYSVRVIDTCGEAVVISVSITAATTGININFGTLSSGELPDCNHVVALNDIFAISPNIIFYPLTVQYTVFPPGGGAPTVVNTTVASGSDSETISGIIPFYNNQQYSYNIKITDACGNIFTKNNNVVIGQFSAVVITQFENCGDNFFVIEPHYYVSPYTITFTTSPAGFNPSGLNINHPTFSSEDATYGGSGAYAPEGDYTAVIVDACNRTTTLNFILVDVIEQPQVNPTDAVCGGMGAIEVTFTIRKVTAAVMTSAPPGYPGPFPLNVSSYINTDGELVMLNMPPGTYTFEITDDCGNVLPATAVIEETTLMGNITALQRPGCDPGYGSVRLTYVENLVNMTITAAPPTFTGPLPFVVSGNIASDGRFYMNSLPAGNYTFQTLNSCNQIVTINVAINGYTINTNEVAMIPHCGSFDVNLVHVSNGSYVQGFFLQKYNPVDGVWEHPQTGADYAEGGQANSINSIVLTNNSVNLSFPYVGQFRVLKTFFVYDNGSFGNVRCTQTLYTFTFDGGPTITTAYSFPCATGLTEVAVIAIGVPPLTYGITTKNGLPFTVNNGQSSLFTGLENATYNFSVTDVCGNIRNILLDISALDALSIQVDGFCQGQDSKMFVPEFTFLDYKWFKEGAPNTILSTTGTLDFPDYDSTTDAGIYHVSITSDNPLSCMNQELTYTLNVNSVPDAGADMTTQFCNDGVAVNLKDFLDEEINKDGEWEDMDATGMLTNSTLTTAGLPEGTYHFGYTVTGLCNQSDVAIFTLEVKNKPQLPVITANTPLCQGSDIQFSATAVAGATYAWSGPNGFTSSNAAPQLQDITAGAAGTYSLVVTVNGCPSETATLAITVNPLPLAGNDAQVPLCNEGNAIVLADYRSGTFDEGGVWEDLDGAGSLNGSTFNTSGIAEGSYQFRYTVTNACNDTDDAVITIQLKDIPNTPAVAGVAPVCQGTDVQLAATEVTNAQYHWTGPDGFESNEQNPLIAGAGLAANGDYLLTVTVNDCTSAAAVVPVTVNALPQFTVEGNTVLCEGQTSVLTVMPGNFNDTSAQYQWSLEGDILAETSGTLNIAQLGTYEVVVSANGCSSGFEIEATLNTNPFELILDSGCVNYDYMLWVANLTDIQGATVTWTGPGNFSFTGTEANITNKPKGEYTATVTNNEGCTAVATITIDNTSCIIPKGISPNNDGLNDNFDLSNLDVTELKIFNRYGLKVYEAQNYRDEWHGQSEKGTLPTGTYYYMITLSAGKQVSGWVYLQREEK